MRALLIALVALSACGRAPVDPSLLPYVERFERDIGVGVGVAVVFNAALPSHMYGRWVPMGAVEINPAKWATLSDAAKEQVMFHEVGHWMQLSADHDYTQTGPDGCPTSIMFPSMFADGACYTSHRSYYIQQLKGLKQ